MPSDQLCIDDLLYELGVSLPRPEPAVAPAPRPVIGRRAMLSLATATAAAAGLGATRLAPGDLPILAQARPAPQARSPEREGRQPAPAAMPVIRGRPARPTAEDLAEWALFRQRFITGDGRVVDTGNGGVSHSEGQGWGLLFAVALDDQPTFDLLLDWTSRNLARRRDALHAWRYLPRAPNPVPDLNNATDADLFIAAALGRAAWQWGRPDLAQAGAAIARDVLRLLVREAGPRVLLLPGANGFEQDGRIAVNPSYYVFPLLDDLAALAPSPVWGRLRADGLALLDEGRFGAFRLPPDWLGVDRRSGALSPHPNWPARFSYDAIRVPLWLAWSGLAAPASQSFAAYWEQRATLPPAWIDLNTNAVAGYPAPPGMIAVARIATVAPVIGVKARLPSGFPALRASPDYYSAALILLARLAWQESRVS